MPIQAGKTVVNQILTQPNWDMRQLLAAAAQRVAAMTGGPNLVQGTPFGLPACGTTYGAGPGWCSQEMAAWGLSLLFAEYLAGLLAEKVEDGHCQTHRKPPDFEPCPEMAKEHKRMLGDFRKALEELAQEIAVLESGLKVPQPLPTPRP